MAVASDTHAFDLEHRPGKRSRSRSPTSALAEFGRNEIRLAEQEMPGLMALRARYGARQPLAGARIMGSLHMTVQTAVLIETLDLLGADVRWVSCNIFSTQDHAAAAVVVGRPETGGTPEKPARHPGLRLEGRDARGVLVVHRAGARVARRHGPDADRRRRRRRDAARAQGPRVRAAAGSVPDFDADDRARGVGRHPRPAAPRARHATRGATPASPADMRGVSEETTTGVHRLYVMAEQGKLLFPAINVNDSVTKSKFDNIYGCRHSLIDGLNRATDVMLGGKVARRRRLRRGRQGLRAGAARPGRARRRHRDRPDLRAAGGDGGLRGRARSRTSSRRADIFITATGNYDIITAEHMARMKDKAIVGNIGHFDNEIDMAGLKQDRGHQADQHQAAVRRVGLPRRPLGADPRRGPAAQPRLRDRPPVAS